MTRNEEWREIINRRTYQEPNTGCWLWEGSAISTGYGNLTWQQSVFLAHRVAFEAFRAPVPAGLDLDHLCRVRRCCNPDHLEPVTRRVNLARGVGAEVTRARHATRTHCKAGHEFTPTNTRLRRGRRECRTCIREQKARTT